MIRKSITTITINNDPLQINALKLGTQKLMKGMKIAKSAWKKDARGYGETFGKSARKKMAGHIKQQKSQWGSARIRQGYKDLG